MAAIARGGPKQAVHGVPKGKPSDGFSSRHSSAAHAKRPQPGPTQQPNACAIPSKEHQQHTGTSPGLPWAAARPNKEPQLSKEPNKEPSSAPASTSPGLKDSGTQARWRRPAASSYSSHAPTCSGRGGEGKNAMLVCELAWQAVMPSSAVEQQAVQVCTPSPRSASRKG